MSWKERLKLGLSRTRQQFSRLWGKGLIDETTWDELNSALISADCGVSASSRLLESLRVTAQTQGINSPEDLRRALVAEIARSLTPLEAPPIGEGIEPPLVLLIAGVNGTGKTTSVGKLCYWFGQQNKKVLLAAGDTFRAAAREQLAVWGERNHVTVVSQQGGDPASVIFDAATSARAKGMDVMIADTAGRLSTQKNLMDELRKVKRVLAKAIPTAPHHCWLVLDGNMGQNALSQVRAFDEVLNLTGLIITKLDGGGRGGVLCAIADACPKPVYFIGVGENKEDLQPFVAQDFALAMLDDSIETPKGKVS